MRQYRILILFILFTLQGNQIALGQDVYKTSSGQVEFNASTPLEDIRAVNKKVNVILKETGDLAVVLLVGEFEFRRKLMQEHFNENYLESDTYPKSYFLGKIMEANLSAVDEKPVAIKITGELSLHGIKKRVTVPGTILRNSAGILLKSSFIIRPEEYKVEIPSLMFKKIAREVEVNFSFQLPRQ
ncbi:YceI family protein [Lentiprolixibacter aurantiacus]|uniref:YceI family protein n=1 Tax=Lentiprolixibacter aurantiacus TaxID=2993939 RepID=A0AAE3SP16_9FLAO|nr:YceI family protein [Lentiprolixibacter aurantiacus]MCX2720224.1 YceI family protein [Lentiprolixibacter aurantiacus]